MSNPAGPIDAWTWGAARRRDIARGGGGVYNSYAGKFTKSIFQILVKAER